MSYYVTLQLSTMIINIIIQFCLLIVAIVALFISKDELKTHKDKENNKLLSQLNKRYLNNDDIQTVVMYLREFDASDTEPSSYQVEVFLRFFEELGAYLKTDSLNPADVEIFFGYYFKQYETTERGKLLKAKINNQDTDTILPYLGVYRKCMSISRNQSVIS